MNISEKYPSLKKSLKQEKIYCFVLSAVIFIIYFFFPNNNFSLDSLGYGSEVKHGGNLFAAHHLLYNFFNWIVYKTISFVIPTIDALRLMQFVNAVFAIGSLLLLRKIIIKQVNDVVKSNILTLFVASCFGIMRFAVEAEAYIIPIFLSLSASFFFYQFLINKKIANVFLSGIFISAACLFHQIHLFWGIALFAGFLRIRNLKSIIAFCLTVLLVPIVYSLVLVFYLKINFTLDNLLRFAAEYFFSDKANFDFGWQNFFITPITFFRTFFQVHGIVADILRLIPVLYLIIPVVIILVFLFFRNLFKTLKIRKFSNKLQPFEFTHLLAFVLQFGFAFYSHGNSEFMVMLPFLLVLFLPSLIDFDMLAIKYLTVAMLVWNFFFAVFPNNIFNYQNNQALVKIIDENPDKTFVLKESGFVSNLYYYETGKMDFERFIDASDEKALSRLQENQLVFSDVFSKKVPFNRGNLVSPIDIENFVFVNHVKWIPSDLRGYYVDVVMYKR